MNGVKKLAVIMAVVSLSAFARAATVSSAQGILDAISAASATEPSVIEVAAGKYDFTSTIAIEKPIALKSESGNPSDVTFNLKSGNRLLLLNNASASVEGVTLKGGSDRTTDNTFGAGRNSQILGGTVRNCVFTGASLVSPEYQAHRAVTVYLSGEDSLMTGCVVSNNTMSGANTGGSSKECCLGVYVAGGATLERSLIAYNRDTGKRGVSRDATGVMVENGLMRYCTVVGNEGFYVGGVNLGSNGRAENCIVYGNRSMRDDPANDDILPAAESRFSNCIISPLSPYEIFWDYAKGDLRTAPGLATSNAGHAFFDAADTVIGLVMFSDAVVVPAEVTFSAACQNVGAGVTYQWDFGDGATDETTDTTIAHTYTITGRKTVKLTVMNGATKVGEVTREIRLCPAVVHVDGASIAPAEPYDSAANAAKDIATALSFAADGAEVSVAKGAYALTSQIVLDRKVSVIGATGDPNDVVLTPASGQRTFYLRHPEAVVGNLSLDGGQYSGGVYGLGLAFWVDRHGGVLTNCIVRNFTQSGSGGSANRDQALFLLAGQQSRMTHCVVSNNESTLTISSTANWKLIGAGLMLQEGAQLVNSQVSDNRDAGNRTKGTPNSYAAGVYASKGEIINCTIVKNTSIQQVGGLRIAAGRVVNTVVAGNSSAVGPDYANVCPGQSALYSFCGIDTYPAGFAPTATGTTATFFSDFDHGDYSIPASSPLKDAGTTEGVVLPAKDLAGKDRVLGDKVDIGAYEVDTSVSTLTFATEEPSIVVPTDVVFEATPTGWGEIGDLTFVWDFGDETDPVEKIGDASVSHRYARGGDCSVSLTVRNAKTGKEQTVVRTDYLHLVPQVMKVAKNSSASAFPYDTDENAATNLQEAIDAAIDHVRIEVGAGVYTNAAPITIEKQLVVTGVPSDKEAVVLYRPSGGETVYMNREGSALLNLTVSGGNRGVKCCGGIKVDSQGGTVSNCTIRCLAFSGSLAASDYCYSAYLRGLNALMTHCVISGNTANVKSPYSAQGAVTLGACVVDGGRLENSLIADNVDLGSRNVLKGYPSAVYVPAARDANGNPVFNGAVVNCTVVRNSSIDGGAFGVGRGSRAVNCVAVANKGDASQYDDVTAETVAYSAENCCFGGEMAELFTDAAANDWRPVFNGPLYRKGTRKDINVPATDLAGRRRLYGLRIDIGAFSGDASGLQILVR